MGTFAAGKSKFMPKFYFRLLLLMGMSTLCIQSSFGQIFPNLGGQRAGISALTFLKNNVSPRSVGMAGADVTLLGDGYCINTNAALASEVRGLTVAMSNLGYSYGLNQTAINVYLPQGEQTTWSVSFNNLSSGPMEKRTEFQSTGTGEYFYAGQMALGLGYSRSVSKQFSFGIFTKYIRESIAEYYSNSLAVDMGFLYRTDYKGLRFGASLQHFGSNSTLSGSGKPISFNDNGVATDNFAAPTIFKMGISMNVLEKQDYKVIAAIQLNHPNDNSENIRLGAEFVYLDKFYLRAGYKINVNGETWPTAGLAFKTQVFTVPFSIDGGMYSSDLLGYYKSVGITIAMPNKAKPASTEIIHD